MAYLTTFCWKFSANSLLVSQIQSPKSMGWVGGCTSLGHLSQIKDFFWRLNKHHEDDLNVIMRLPFSRWPRSPCWSRLKSGNLATLVQSQFSSLDRRPRRRRKKSGCFSQLTAWQMFEHWVNTKNYWNQPTKPCITYQYFFSYASSFTTHPCELGIDS